MCISAHLRLSSTPPPRPRPYAFHRKPPHTRAYRLFFARATCPGQARQAAIFPTLQFHFQTYIPAGPASYHVTHSSPVKPRTITLWLPAHVKYRTSSLLGAGLHISHSDFRAADACTSGHTCKRSKILPSTLPPRSLGDGCRSLLARRGGRLRGHAACIRWSVAG